MTRSLHHLQNDARHSVFFYVLLTFFSIFFVGFVSVNNYEGGFAVGLLFVSHAFLFLGFLLRKKYFDKTTASTDSLMFTIHRFLKPALGLGLLSYIAIAAMVIQIHPNIMTFLAEQRPTIAADYEFTTYRNNEAGYAIDYPNPWSVYRWNDTSITIYTNDTGTEVGGIKVNIDVHPAASSNYFTLFEANPGLVTYDTGTKNVTTKIANVVINGRDMVKYTYTKTDVSQTEFQTHYLIRNNDTVYDIAFVTVSKKIESGYKDIFDKMLESFLLLPN
jgi:hypothetical protein